MLSLFLTMKISSSFTSLFILLTREVNGDGHDICTGTCEVDSDGSKTCTFSAIVNPFWSELGED